MKLEIPQMPLCSFLVGVWKLSVSHIHFHVTQVPFILRVGGVECGGTEAHAKYRNFPVIKGCHEHPNMHCRRVTSSI